MKHLNQYIKEVLGEAIQISPTPKKVIIINETGFTPRTTKDIDIILVVEALTSEFVKQFWQFSQIGNYGHQEKIKATENIDMNKLFKQLVTSFKLTTK